jgi:hypothetical protein
MSAEPPAKKTFWNLVKCSTMTAWLRVIVYVFVVASVSASTYFLMQDQLEKASVVRIQRLVEAPEKARQEFAPRIASVLVVKAFYTRSREQMKERLVVYFSLSMALLGAIYWLTSKQASLLSMYGTFTALYYCTTPVTLDTWYPWDMPALLLSALGLLLALRQKVVLLAALSVVSVAFKETLLLSALYICFFPSLKPKARYCWCGGALALGVVTRIITEKLLGRETQHSDFLHDHGKPQDAFRIIQNFDELFSLRINHLLWANAGLILFVLLFPAGSGVLRGARYIALVFLGGIFLLGKVSEYRILLELLPVSLLLAQRLFGGETTSLPEI